MVGRAVRGWSYLPYLPALSLELDTQGSCPAQLIFQLPRALRVACVSLLQLPHLPPELMELTQATAAAVQSSLQLPCTFGGLPEKGMGSGKFRGWQGSCAGVVKGFQTEGFGFKVKASARSVVLVGVIRETGYNGKVLRSGTADREEL